MDNNLNQDLTIDELDKLTEEGKIKEITVTLTSIYDGTEFTNVNGDPYIVYHWPYPDIEYMNLSGDASKTYARFSLPRSCLLMLYWIWKQGKMQLTRFMRA